MIPTEILDLREVIGSTDLGKFQQSALNSRRWFAAHDHHYPLYHFAPIESWINDPNGPIWYHDRYHLFYQFDPMIDDNQAGWVRSQRCMGHAVSSDLVHWEDWPVAIWPDSQYDRKGVYSGNTFVDQNDRLCMLYTGNVQGHRESYGLLAVSTDDGLTFQKQMVMHDSQRPNERSPVHWDGYVWPEENTWCQLVGGSTGGNNPKGAAWLWKSQDLAHWDLQGNIAPGISLGEFWELPYLIPLGGRHVLMVGSKNNPYWIGGYDSEKMLFVPDKLEPEYIDVGSFYCVNPNLSDSRRVLMGWALLEELPVKPGVPYWQHAHTLPRSLTIENDRLMQQPITELESLRQDKLFESDSGDTPALLTLPELSVELSLEVQLRDRVELIVSAGQGKQRVTIWIDPAISQFGIGEKSVSVSATYGEVVSLRLFLDRCITEIFMNGKALTHVEYLPDLEATLSIKKLESTIRSFTVWHMGSMWPICS